MKRYKYKSEGFTLIELIVVLLIISILIAIAVPAMTGYIEKAQQDQVAAEAKQVKTAAQSIGVNFYAENYGSWGTWNSDDTSYEGENRANMGGAKLHKFIEDLCELSGIDGITNYSTNAEVKKGNKFFCAYLDKTGTISRFYYVDDLRYTYFENGKSIKGKMDHNDDAYDTWVELSGIKLATNFGKTTIERRYSYVIIT